MISIPKELNQWKGMEQTLRIIIKENFPEIKKDLIFYILFWVVITQLYPTVKMHQSEHLRHMHFTACLYLK